MRKETILILIVTLLVAGGIVGAIYYSSSLGSERTEPISESATSTAAVPERYTGANAPDRSTQNSARRTDQILRCENEEVGVFYTNAATCEEADLDNRLSHAQPLPKPEPEGFMAQARETARQWVSKEREPNIRQVARDVPEELNTECKFAVGKALEIERDLSAADDPFESIWREDYCRWIDEARSAHCELESGFFYYGNLCGRF